MCDEIQTADVVGYEEGRVTNDAKLVCQRIVVFNLTELEHFIVQFVSRKHIKSDQRENHCEKLPKKQQKHVIIYTTSIVCTKMSGALH